MSRSLEALGARAGWGDPTDLIACITDPDRLSAALTALREASGTREHAVLLMHDVQGLPLDQVAEGQGISEDAARASLHRARLMLMSLLRAGADE